MSSLTDLPNPATFGESFNYAVWTPNTLIELCNVPWNSDYRDIVQFANQAELDAYLESTGIGPRFTITKATLARAGDPVRVNLPFNSCYQFNYLRVDNGNNPISATYRDSTGTFHTVAESVKTLYYFIQDVQYIAPNTTQLTVMLDVWQTFGRDIQFGNCYIERGHIAIANENQFVNNGRDYLTVPEALDVGPEYNVNRTYRFQIPDNQIQDDSLEDGAWVVVGVSADIDTDPGTTSAPNLSTTSNLSSTDGMPNGFDLLYFKTVESFQNFITNFSQQPWITQTIMFITLVPPISGVGGTLVPAPIWNTTTNAHDSTMGAYRLQNQDTPLASKVIATNFRDGAEIPSRYSILKKFLTAPYMWIELTTYNGSPLLMRPELIPSDNIEVYIFEHSAPPSPRWAIVPQHYNATGTDGDVDDGEFLDFATFISNFPQFTVLNNNYLEYLASNRNSIAYSYSSADWSQQKALQAAGTDMSNVNSGISQRNAQALVDTSANSEMTHIGNVARIGGGIENIGQSIGGALGPASGAVNALTGGLDAAVSVARANAENNVRNRQITGTTGNQNAYAMETSARNYDFAKFAAKGDYQNAINAVQARVQDARLIQPSSVGQLGGESFIASIFGPNSDVAGGLFQNRISVGWRIYAKLKQVSPGYMAIIGEYWLRYGYAVNRFGRVPVNLHCMTKFTYWKMKETYIVSSVCPEVFKQTIRGIFEKGVTVWTTPSDIGNIDLATNEPLTGITL
jgi:hypothetical protein